MPTEMGSEYRDLSSKKITVEITHVVWKLGVVLQRHDTKSLPIRRQDVKGRTWNSLLVLVFCTSEVNVPSLSATRFL